MTDYHPKAPEATEFILSKIQASLDWDNQYRSVGRVVAVRDGILTLMGVSNVQAGEVLELENGQQALAFNLESDSVGAVVLGNADQISSGMSIQCTGSVLSIPVGRGLLGRVIDPLGRPLDGLGPIECSESRPIEQVAPGVKDRHPVNQPLKTGLKTVDILTPIGRGQRQLIIGDRQTGKTSIAIDAMINQKDQNVVNIYVAIGQKGSTLSVLIDLLRRTDTLKNSVVVIAGASDAASLQYIAPYAGCAIGEFFRDCGEDALIVYDDLSKHAVAYRQISLLLRRPPGREAYPGDIFYLHSRLLERAARVNADYVEKMTQGAVKGKTGSLTALPIIETQADDLYAFIPTNVISITDGQVFLDSNLFRAGSRPALNPGFSVSRVGSVAQVPAVQKLGGMIRLILAQYRELEAFSQFAGDLDEGTQRDLQQGQKVSELLKQDLHAPLSVAEMVISLMLIHAGLLEKLRLEQIRSFEQHAQRFVTKKDPALIASLQAGEWHEGLKITLTEHLHQAYQELLG